MSPTVLHPSEMVFRILTASLLLACSGGGDPNGADGAADDGSPQPSGLDSDSSSGSLEFVSSQDLETSVDAEDRCVVRADPDATCVGRTYQGETIPLDIYVMFDQSGSTCSCLTETATQSCPNAECPETRLDAIRRAAGEFLLDPASAGIGVGLGLFGSQPIGEASCEVGDHDRAVVDVGTLPEHASLVIDALSRVEPTGETPTAAAIRGACQVARAHRERERGRKTVILLLTDGKPEAPLTCAGGSGACCPTLDDAVDAARECADGDLGIPTYVLGVGPLLDNLDQIAVAGGTEHAYLVEGEGVAQQVLEALNRIRGDAIIPCRFQLPEPPPGESLDFQQVNLSYASPRCEGTRFYAVREAAECGSEDGWYYDDPTAPRAIELCPASCDRVAEPGGQLLYSVGCSTEYRIR